MKLNWYNYPGIFDRVKAVTIDGFFMIILMYLASEIFKDFESVNGYIRTGTYLFIFFLYEPLFVSLWGASIGHNSIGIRVCKKGAHSKRISFPLAIVRNVIKYFLGAFSLFTISSDEQRRALHDIVVSSTVIYTTK